MVCIYFVRLDDSRERRKKMYEETILSILSYFCAIGDPMYILFSAMMSFLICRSLQISPHVHKKNLILDLIGNVYESFNNN